MGPSMARGGVRTGFRLGPTLVIVPPCQHQLAEAADSQADKGATRRAVPRLPNKNTRDAQLGKSYIAKTKKTHAAPEWAVPKLQTAKPSAQAGNSYIAQENTRNARVGSS